MSNKPKKEKRLAPYNPNEKERAYTSLCVNAYGTKGTTKNMKQLKPAAKNGLSKLARGAYCHIPGFK